jgi:hypothetical protein
MITRRAVLTMAAIATLLSSRPGLAAANRGLPRSLRLRASRLTGIFSRRQSARAVGRAYLRVAPGEADPQILMGAITGTTPDLHRVLDHGDDADLGAALRNRIRRDFADGRTVSVEGWLLSQTEARLCALAELV